MNNTFSVHHYCFCFIYLFYDFTIKLGGKPLTLRWRTFLDALCVFRCPGARCLEGYIWSNELSRTAK